MTGYQPASADDIDQAVLPKFEPEPDLSDEAILRSIVGIRPFREGGFRIEYKQLGDKAVIHNYGHGGAGVTLSWGSAAEVVRLAKLRAFAAKSACVIGAGVIGLTSALLLQQTGMKVRVVSEQFTPKTTSDIAGAQWAPSLVDPGKGAERSKLFDRVQRDSFAKFRALEQSKYGISIRPNYVEGDHDTSFYKIPEGVIPPSQVLASLPFPSSPFPGRVFTTLFIQPPIFMPQLMQDCRDASIALETMKLESGKQIQDLPEDLIVNCTGFGAAKLMDDRQMVPIRGQLVIAKPKKLPWLLSHRNGYIFPREDGIVLGGTVERGVSDLTNTDEGVAKILRGNRSFFQNG